MVIPRNGKVVIIDDRYEDEALPLIQALSKEGISFSYFNGRKSELPAVPINGVRLLFLDLKLEGLPESFDDDDIINSVVPVISSIVSPNNGPYIIFGWTDKPAVLEKVVSQLESKPVTFTSMDKVECLSSTNKIQIIKEKLYEKFDGLGKVGLIFHWENFINKSIGSTTNDLFEIVKNGNSNSLEDVLYKLSESHLGSHIDTVEDKIKIRSAFHLMNNLLIDTTKRNVYSEDFSKAGILQYSKSIDENALYKINTKLLFNLHPSNDNVPGNIYRANHEPARTLCNELFNRRLEPDSIKKHAKNIVKSSHQKDWNKLKEEEKENLIEKENEKIRLEIMDKSEFIMIEITPVCDYSQNEMKTYRVLTGFMFPKEFSNFINKSNNNESAYYMSPFFFYNEKVFKIVIGYRFFTTLDKEIITGLTPIISLNQELLFDIQHRIGAHFSRPGVLTVV